MPIITDYKDYGWTEGATEAHSYLYPTLYKMLEEHKGKRMLDVGCGNGVTVCRLLEGGFDVYGIDASETGIDIAKRKYPNRFFVQDVLREHLPDELSHYEFDVLISIEVIEHIYMPGIYMKFIRNCLGRNGGELIISAPYHGYLKNLVLAITGRMDNHFTALWDGGHIKFWSKKTLSTLLMEHGFEVTEFRGSGRLPYLWKSMFIRARIDKMEAA